MIIKSKFKPAWWLASPHAQTIYPSLFRKTRLPALQRKRLELPDGDFVDLDWTPDTSGPLVLILHGLEGNIQSHYAAGVLSTLYKASMTIVFMHFRGCSGEPNRLTRSYHSGETSDLKFVVRTLRNDYPTREISIIGFSLGGNVLLKWLGEQAVNANIQRAVAISVPFELSTAADVLEQGASRLYQRYLLNRLLRSVQTKMKIMDLPIDAQDLRKLTTLRAFDNTVTAPLNGFSSAEDYYSQCSSRQFLTHIRTPTLIIHAEDDPFMNTSVIPKNSELSESVTLEISKHGGHVGFISSHKLPDPIYWLDLRIRQFLLDAEERV
ncbi:MAG: hydrolase [Gammaproteobacteria bacterium]